jgi:hypothetical protein
MKSPLRAKLFHHLACDPIILQQLNALLSFGNNKVKCSINLNEPRRAGAITAAQFLQRFVGDVPWAHLDIAGVADNLGRAYAAKGGSGWGVRMLVDLIDRLATDRAA